MELPLTDGCQCGKIRYEITEAPQLVYTCHCTDCEPLSRSASAAPVIDDGMQVTASAPRAGLRSYSAAPRESIHPRLCAHEKRAWIRTELTAPPVAGTRQQRQRRLARGYGVVLRGTEGLLTHRWREMDSNFQYASIVRWHQATDLPLPPFVEEERSESGRADYRAMSR
jgi:hypothetical protein